MTQQQQHAAGPKANDIENFCALRSGRFSKYCISELIVRDMNVPPPFHQIAYSAASSPMSWIAEAVHTSCFM